jgi:hypothetical protein
MFGDYGWKEDRFEGQLDNYEAWIASLKEKKDTRLVVIEIGAGTVSHHRTRTTAHTTATHTYLLPHTQARACRRCESRASGA